MKHVSQTKIFARGAEGGRQYLVYSMNVSLAEDLAMILPLPTPPGTPEDGVRFIDLSGYPNFFDDMGRAFPEHMLPGAKGGMLASRGVQPQQQLRVHAVGEFEASFVPSLGDMARLDPRFRLPPRVFEGIPQYRDHGFAVFKLKKAGGLFGWFRRMRTIHPMAMELPRRDPGSLFFPTVHVHDGEYRPEASFDHTLYCQPDPHLEMLLDWERSERPMASVMRGDSAGIVAPAAHGYRRVLLGAAPNRDVVIEEGELRAATTVGDHFLLRTTGSGAGQAGGRGQGWPDVTPAERGRIKEEMVRRLMVLTREHQDDWHLARYRGDLPDRWPTLYEAFPERPSAPEKAEPCRVKFFVWNQRVEPHEVSLAFTEEPSRELREAITTELQVALDQVAAV